MMDLRRRVEIFRQRPMISLLEIALAVTSVLYNRLAKDDRAADLRYNASRAWREIDDLRRELDRRNAIKPPPEPVRVHRHSTEQGAPP